MFQKSAATILRTRYAKLNPISVRFLSSQAPAQVKHHVVSLDEAKKMPKYYKHFSNDVILTMASVGDQDAREERLIREIMAVDNLE